MSEILKILGKYRVKRFSTREELPDHPLEAAHKVLPHEEQVRRNSEYMRSVIENAPSQKEIDPDSYSVIHDNLDRHERLIKDPAFEKHELKDVIDKVRIAIDKVPHLSKIADSIFGGGLTHSQLETFSKIFTEWSHNPSAVSSILKNTLKNTTVKDSDAILEYIRKLSKIPKVVIDKPGIGDYLNKLIYREGSKSLRHLELPAQEIKGFHPHNGYGGPGEMVLIKDKGDIVFAPIVSHYEMTPQGTKIILNMEGADERAKKVKEYYRSGYTGSMGAGATSTERLDNRLLMANELGVEDKLSELPYGTSMGFHDYSDSYTEAANNAVNVSNSLHSSLPYYFRRLGVFRSIFYEAYHNAKDHFKNRFKEEHGTYLVSPKEFSNYLEKEFSRIASTYLPTHIPGEEGYKRAMAGMNLHRDKYKDTIYGDPDMYNEWESYINKQYQSREMSLAFNNCVYVFGKKRRFSARASTRMSLPHPDTGPLVKWEGNKDKTGDLYHFYSVHPPTKAVASGKHIMHSSATNDREGNIYYRFIVSDPSGHVTLHRATVPPHDENPIQSALRQAFPGIDKSFTTKHSEPIRSNEVREYSDIGEHKSIKDKHSRIVNNKERGSYESNYVGRLNVHKNVIPFLMSIHNNPNDDSPFLIFSDYLEENGYHHTARRIRRLTEEPSYLRTPFHVMDILSYGEDENKEQITHSWKKYNFSMNTRFALTPHIEEVVPYHAHYPETRYATNMTDTQWSRVRDVLRTSSRNVKQLVNAMLFRLTYGVPLRRLPADMPPWGTVHSFEYHVLRSGLMPMLLQAAGREFLMEAAQNVYRVLGRMSLGMSHKDEPLIKVEHVGKEAANYYHNRDSDYIDMLHHSYGSHPRRGSYSYNQLARHWTPLDVYGGALEDGKLGTNRDINRPPNTAYISDVNGNITRWTGPNIDDEVDLVKRNIDPHMGGLRVPVFMRGMRRIPWQDERGITVESLHNAAVNDGNIYAKIHVHPSIKPFIDAIASHPGDEAPLLTFSDYLSENGKDEIGNHLRWMVYNKEPHIHRTLVHMLGGPPTPLSEVPTDKQKDPDPNVVRITHAERTPEIPRRNVPDYSDESGPVWSDLHHPETKISIPRRPSLNLTVHDISSGNHTGRYYLKKITHNPESAFIAAATADALKELGVPNAVKVHPHVRAGQFYTIGKDVGDVVPLLDVIRDGGPERLLLFNILEKNSSNDMARWVTAMQLIGAADRHSRNVLVGRDGSLHHIDFDMTLYPHGGDVNSNELVDYLIDKNHPVDRKSLRSMIAKRNKIMEIYDRYLQPPYFSYDHKKELLHFLKRRFNYYKKLLNKKNLNLQDLHGYYPYVYDDPDPSA